MSRRDSDEEATSYDESDGAEASDDELLFDDDEDRRRYEAESYDVEDEDMFAEPETIPLDYEDEDVPEPFSEEPDDEDAEALPSDDEELQEASSYSLYMLQRRIILEEMKTIDNETHPEYISGAKEIDDWLKEELQDVERIIKGIEERNTAEYESDVKINAQELEARRVQVQDQLIRELEDKRKHTEQERNAMDLHNDSFEFKPMVTRKLRRRAHDPAAPQSKKGGSRGPTSLKILVEEEIALTDLFEMDPELVQPYLPLLGQSTRRSNREREAHFTYTYDSPSPVSLADMSPEVRVEDGKLYFDKKWYNRNQPIFLEGRDYGRIAGTLSSVQADSIWIKKVTGGARIQVFLGQLFCGRCSIRRRPQ
ncbi:unnamed protein product [Notodromas monacha]|uniref:Sin3 histone deacetylase corepressor complex component SDS3 n=1 Tax=Notodromas monacha TaxID=399045 RepID=A0A7R9BY39_9CRUS|nr:unnamed protein product [Notodromas monacha]CAG0922380.1 unnamed protein product [Notodromas monacha]